MVIFDGFLCRLLASLYSEYSMGENALNKLSIPSFLVDANPPPKWEMSSVDEPWSRNI